MAKLPEALPIHRHARGAFHELSVGDVSRCYRAVAQQLLETYRHTMDDPGEDVDAQMNELIAAYQELASLETSSRSLDARLESAKQKYRESSHNLEPVDLSWWNRYSSKSPDGLPKLSDIFEREEISPGRRSRLTREDKLLDAIAYLWRDPTGMMPDEQNNDEDVHIEGGKIELRCPITCQDFKQPMISKKCNHVFDLEGLQEYFKDHATRDCAQGGCSQKLSMSDFEEDEIMRLRCQIEKVKKKSSTEEQIAMDVI
ncbi:hypothetical protein HG536_0G03600 [Torulaspora globosa]|uniref:SP-RING-type domain-containing protein n=1 Tax=Torulaspora globosa TaxID=48254 RepID=A0A7G3ZLW2_9SACH|nr:uncharacterized protein HG536_0G03600 [Torulaspora globosa]QLL34498.1 hypothetical protein HG536_0G03600 [Torulaspora globosa]